MTVTTITAATKRLLADRRIRWSLIIVALAFAMINGIVYVIYRDQTYPNTTVAGHHLGSVSDSDLLTTLKKLPLLPTSVQFSASDTKAKVTTNELGITPNYHQLRAATLRQRSWLPIANMWTKHDVAVQLSLKQTALQSAVTSALGVFQQTAGNAKISYQDGEFRIIPDSTGQTVDTTTTRNRLVSSLQAGKASVAVATKSTNAEVTANSLQARLAELKAQARTEISVGYTDKTKRFTAAEVGSWYVEAGNDMSLSDAAITSAINATGASFGIIVQNRTEAVSAIKAAIERQKTLVFALVAAPKASKTFTYCVASRGVSDSTLPELAAKLQATFNDSRGWNLDGSVSFVAATSGCTFTVWLAAADQMPTFGAICDAEWSCAVSPNVVINYDRWRYASTAWNNQGGSLEDYRAMVINHETGHWLGFYHSFCGGAGQQAPVMQQQSIDLQGCSFNPWPTASERDSLKARLGL